MCPLQVSWARQGSRRSCQTLRFVVFFKLSVKECADARAIEALGFIMLRNGKQTDSFISNPLAAPKTECTALTPAALRDHHVLALLIKAITVSCFPMPDRGQSPSDIMAKIQGLESPVARCNIRNTLPISFIHGSSGLVTRSSPVRRG